MDTRILVLGSGDVGSAVAHRLFLTGADVVLADEPAPVHPRRGMAFTDAWFDGTATLAGVVGLLVSDVDDLAGAGAAIGAIPCTAAALPDIVAAWHPQALVDARMRKRAVPADLRSWAAQAIGLGPGFMPGVNCSVAIETAWGADLGAVRLDRPTTGLAGEPRALDGIGRERFVYAPQSGRWQTRRCIGDRVTAKEQLGVLQSPDGELDVRAPLAGALRGLAHDGVSVRAGQKLLEVDPRPQPDTHGLGSRPAAIARGVWQALGLHRGLDDAFLGFEAGYRRTMDCMPMSMRRKLDRCGCKLSLAQWRALPRTVRETLVEAPDHARHLERLRRFLHRHAQQAGWPAMPGVGIDTAVDQPDRLPAAVCERCAAEGSHAPTLAAWAALTPLQRYALTKLAGQRSGRNWQQALVAFGLLRRWPRRRTRGAHPLAAAIGSTKGRHA